MKSSLHVHIITSALFFLFAFIVFVLWSFPKIIVMILLGIAAVMAYGALYLILAAWLAPTTLSRKSETEAESIDSLARPSERSVAKKRVYKKRIGSTKTKTTRKRASANKKLPLKGVENQ